MQNLWCKIVYIYDINILITKYFEISNMYKISNTYLLYKYVIIIFKINGIYIIFIYNKNNIYIIDKYIETCIYE